MAEDVNRDGREDGQNPNGQSPAGQGAGSVARRPFTLSQLEKTEKPADFTVADLSAQLSGTATGSGQAVAGAAQGGSAAASSSSRGQARTAGSGHIARTAGTSRLVGRDASLSAGSAASSATPGSRVSAASAGSRNRAGQQGGAGSSTGTPKRRVPRARRMKLSVTKVSPWSVAKVTFMLSIAMGIIQTVCVAILYGIIDAAGVFDKITSLVSQTGLAGNFNMSSILSIGQVLSAVVIFSVFEVVIMVLLSVIFAFLYNVASSLVGGIHVTLGDD